ncbi:MAG: serine hydrolase [Blastocatellia bacterium]|nr:serine hydrolase [Blastocatellia bacterium]
MVKPITRNLFLVFAIVAATASAYAQSNYVPPRGEWQRKTPAEVKMNGQAVKAAVDFAIANESNSPRSLELAHYQTFGREPFGEAVGHFKERGAATGIIIRNGYIVAEWGDLNRADMTFSVTKSFVSAAVGLALDRKLIRNLNDRASDYSAPISVHMPGDRMDVAERFGRPQFIDLFSGKHNSTITWDNLLRQTSDWEGTLWGKPDWADRPDRDNATWLTRERKTAGSVYEYNDVRVNVLALAATNVWRRPLPEVVKELLMDEIGASSTWRWYGYENSWINIDGRIIQAVSGGGHWGGGMFINAYDMARFGLLTSRNGRWGAKQILSDEFIRQAKTPTPAQPTYGFMNWFLNTDRKLYANAPASAIAHLGNGTNIVYIDPDNDLVVVARWIDNSKVNEFVRMITESTK